MLRVLLLTLAILLPTIVNAQTVPTPKLEPIGLSAWRGMPDAAKESYINGLIDAWVENGEEERDSETHGIPLSGWHHLKHDYFTCILQLTHGRRKEIMSTIEAFVASVPSVGSDKDQPMPPIVWNAFLRPCAVR